MILRNPPNKVDFVLARSVVGALQLLRRSWLLESYGPRLCHWGIHTVYRFFPLSKRFWEVILTEGRCNDK